jgi:hypothetical protein
MLSKVHSNSSRKKRTLTGDIVVSSYHYITNRIITQVTTLRAPRICYRVT